MKKRQFDTLNGKERIWDVIVIGAGISGCSVARELGRYQLKSLVLEKGSDLAPATTRGNSATVHAGYDPDPGTNKAKYNVLGSRMYPALCAELEVPYVKNGMILFAVTGEQLEECRKLQQRGTENGVKTVLCDREALLKIEPEMGEGVIGGLWIPDSGMVCPYNLAIAEAENAAINGVEFRLNTEVSGIKKDGDFWTVQTGSGEELHAGYIVNCAGTHADRFNNMVSRDTFTIIPREGQHIVLDRELYPYTKTTICQTPEPLTTGGHTKGMGLMPSVDGTVILGCNADDVPDPDFNLTTKEGLDKICDYFSKNWKYLPVSRKYPDFPRDKVITAYGGSRAHCDRDDFILGEPEDAKGFLNMAGMESPGLTAAPAAAIDLVKVIAERENAEVKADWKKGRNVKKPFREMSLKEQREAIEKDSDYAKIVCRCEQITEAEIRDAIRRPIPATSINAIKMRVRAGMGRCQGGFCSPRVMEILCEELGMEPEKVTLSGKEDHILDGKACRAERNGI